MNDLHLIKNRQTYHSSERKYACILIWSILLLLSGFWSGTLLAQCPVAPAQCDYVVTSGTANYVLNPGDTLCIPSGSFNGTVEMRGGVVMICSDAPQGFQPMWQAGGGTIYHLGSGVWFNAQAIYGTTGTVYNYGTIDHSGNVMLQSQFRLHNYGTFLSGGGFMMTTSSELHNYGVLDTESGDFTHSAAGGYLFNYTGASIIARKLTIHHNGYNAGQMSSSGDECFFNSAQWTMNGGCLDCGDFTLTGTFHGGICGTIFINGTSMNTGSISAPMAIVNSSVPAWPFVDNNFGSIAPTIQGTSCGCPGTAPLVEDCSNGIDDDGDGLIDSADPDCQDQDGDGVYDPLDIDDDNDGLRDVTECPDMGKPYLLNGRFENPDIIATGLDNGPNDVVGTSGVWKGDASHLPIWESADMVNNHLELWHVSHSVASDAGGTAYFGNQWSEVNASSHDGMYQDIATSPGDDIEWAFAHRKRTSYSGSASEDILELLIGPASGPGVSQGTFTSAADASWTFYTGTYTVPPGQTMTRVHFTSLSTASGSALFGNYIDEVSFQVIPACPDSDGDGVTDHMDLDSDNDGIYDVIEAGGSDADMDGIIGSGSVTDTDGDGWSDITDPDNGGAVLADGDLDGDTLQNRIDPDSDADGCADVIEAGFPDTDGDGQLGGLAPPTVDTSGKVTSGGL